MMCNDGRSGGECDRQAKVYLKVDDSVLCAAVTARIVKSVVVVALGKLEDGKLPDFRSEGEKR